ncbi:unnamed protein product, partial [Prorocentrum cordatum]
PCRLGGPQAPPLQRALDAAPMAPAGLLAQPARTASPRSAGRQLGARLLELGRLPAGGAEELLVIEASPASGRAAGPVRPARLLGGARAAACAAPAPAAVRQREKEDEVDPIVEEDLSLEDFDDEQEVSLRDLSAVLPDPWAPGSAKGRQLMTARAKQCVICMEDKEHTLVPPHKGCGEGMNFEGHRVCTGCWEDLLRHELDRHWGHQGPLPGLTCPVCRGGVLVPDAWGVELDLPEEWIQRSRPHLAGCGPLGDALVAQPGPSQKWACAAAAPPSRGWLGAALPGGGGGSAAAPTRAAGRSSWPGRRRWRARRSLLSDSFLGAPGEKGRDQPAGRGERLADCVKQACSDN